MILLRGKLFLALLSIPSHTIKYEVYNIKDGIKAFPGLKVFTSYTLFLRKLLKSVYNGREGINGGKKRRARRHGISERREEGSIAITCAASIENSRFRLSSENRGLHEGNAFKKKHPRGFSDGSVVKNLPASAVDTGSVPDPGTSYVQQGS